MARILVIDDECTIAMVLKLILEHEGYEAVTVHDGGAALVYLEKNPPPDLVITDLKLPVVDGRTVVEHMYSNPNLREIPVIIISGSIPSQENLPRQESFSAFLEKPFDLDELVGTVKSLLAFPKRAMSFTAVKQHSFA